MNNDNPKIEGDLKELKSDLIQTTKLDKAIERLQHEVDSHNGPDNLLADLQVVLLVAKRAQELEHKFTEHSNAELLGETECCQFEEMKVRLKEVEKERDELQAKVLQLEPETVALTYDVERLREHLANVNRENMDNRKAFENEYSNHQDTTKHCEQLRDGLKVCKEALKDLMTEPSCADEQKDGTIYQYSFQSNSALHYQILKALSHPAVQGLKESKNNS